ncbi:hypothetical protein EPN90_04220 [Patescibacteria group bacterium]|nr:MAG: hypothetical protein EPN90_04220 [Patescibacteria group bacterium]
MPNHAEIKQFFFGASREACRKSGAEAAASAFYQKGDWRYTDDCHTIGKRVLGQILIWWREQPVWGMHYRGWRKDDERVIPFLRQALLSAYEEEIWVGGRGPTHFTSDGLEYHNLPANLDFADFSGEETILDPRNEAVLLWHGYAGFSLI